MPENTRSHRVLDRTLLVLFAALMLFASPLALWWATEERAWYLPYLVWAGVLVLVALLQGWLRRHDL